MKHLKSLLGFTVAGLFVMGPVWGTFGENGILSGFIGGTIIIGGLWYLNHFWGLIHNDDEAVFIDMALGIAVAGIVRDTLQNGTGELTKSLPTLILVIIGGVLAGIVSYYIETHDEKKELNKEEN